MNTNHRTPTISAQLKAIPTPDLSEKKKKILQQRNSELDKENLAHTMEILECRKQEAICDGDQKKKFHATALEYHQRDQFNSRNRIRELQKTNDDLKGQIPEEMWSFLQKFSDLKDPKYWEKARQNGYSDTDISTYYKDVWGIEPKYVVKFLQIMKNRKEIEQLEKLI